MAYRQLSCLAIFMVLGAASAANCPPFWTRYGNNCYRFFGPPRDWREAEKHCQGFFMQQGQGHLASIHSADENQFLIQLWTSSIVPNSAPQGISVWLGLNDRESEGDFSWSDGTAYDFKDAWRHPQPDDHEGEDCGSFSQSDASPSHPIGWNDDECDTALPYICKMPADE